MDLFKEKNVQPMLIGATGEPTDDENYIYELKYDGERAIVYLDDKAGTELRNKRNRNLLPTFPELSEIHKRVKGRVILDGEYIVLKDGRPNFAEVQKRSLMNNSFKIKLAAERLPVSFIAFDILYKDGKELTDLPVEKRKEILFQTVSESPRIAVSKHIQDGVAFFEIAERQVLEGVVAKKKGSLYHFGKRTKDWVKIKTFLDDDFIVCGYIRKSNNTSSIVLGQYNQQKELIYKGHVTMGVSGTDFKKIQATEEIENPFFKALPKGNEKAIWIRPEHVCKVEFMEYTSNGGMRRSIFKGLRDDKIASEIIEVKTPL